MTNTIDGNKYKTGMTQALISVFLWGVLPLYWQAMIPIKSEVIIFYRIILVCLLALAASLVLYGPKAVFEPIKNSGVRVRLLLAGVLITANWSIYIWAVNANHVIQTCIGYYIEPLMVCVFGIMFFHEKLTRYKAGALICAGIGIVVILIHFMQVPYIALGLAVTFAVYAALKKQYDMPALPSLFYETMFLMPFALAVVIWMEVTGRGAIGVGEPYQYILLLGTGICTVIPLGCFGAAATKVPLITLGILDYISPSMTLVIGIFIFHEAFDMVQFIAFIIIWVGLIYFTYGEFKLAREARNKAADSCGDEDIKYDIT